MSHSPDTGTTPDAKTTPDVGATPDAEPRPAIGPRRPSSVGSGGWWAAWIGIGFIVGALVGAVLNQATPGGANVSSERSLMWLAMVLGTVGAFVGALAAIVIDARAHR